MYAAVRFVESFSFICQRICLFERDKRLTLWANLSIRNVQLTRAGMKQKDLYNIKVFL